MSMMPLNEVPRRFVGDGVQAKLPVEHQATGTIVRNATKRVTADLLQFERPQQLAGPGRIVVHVNDDLFMESCAAGLQHEVMSPDFEK